jgi:DNA sulfur modification protein DndB
MSHYFEYVFPVLRTKTETRCFYICSFPIKIISKLFFLNKEEIPEEIRAQQALDNSFIPEIANYIIENPIHQVFVEIAAFVDAELTFEPFHKEGVPEDFGFLRVPMDAKIEIFEGDHRLAALQLAFHQKPELGEQTIKVIFYSDVGLKNLQYNREQYRRYGLTVYPDPFYKTIYDERDYKLILGRAIVPEVNVFRHLTDTQRNTLPVRSKKLFTLSSIQNATVALLINHKKYDLVDQIEIAILYWNAVSKYIPDWQNVLQGSITAGEIRRNKISSHAVSLSALGHLGACLLAIHSDDWREKLLNVLSKLLQIDWSRSNPEFQSRIIFDGRISKSLTTVSLITSYLKKHFDLPLTSEEKQLEQNKK